MFWQELSPRHTGVVRAVKTDGCTVPYPLPYLFPSIWPVCYERCGIQFGTPVHNGNERDHRLTASRSCAACAAGKRLARVGAALRWGRVSNGPGDALGELILTSGQSFQLCTRIMWGLLFVGGLAHFCLPHRRLRHATSALCALVFGYWLGSCLDCCDACLRVEVG